MKNKKYMAIPLVLIMALGIVGYAYASWYNYLYVEGQVDTANLDWGFTAWDCIDTGVDYHCREGFAGPYPLFWTDPEGKNVGWQELIPHDTDGDGDYDTLEFNLYNVYPSYFTSVSVYAVNTGNIPLIIDGVDINGVVYLRHSPTPIIRLDLNGDGYDDVEIWWGNGFGVQLEPGDWSPEMSFWIHILQNPYNMGKTFSFYIGLVAINWNEYIP